MSASARAHARRVAAAAVPVALSLILAAAPAASARVARPDPAAKAAIVVDGRSGEVLFAEEPDARRPIASATKLMTALLAMERAKPTDVFAAPRYDAAPVESQIGLETGERMRVRDLLTALLLESANDAAATIATNVSGSRRAFVAEMNARARSLGLRSTRYTNPIGLDARRNRSSARDLATLARVLLRDRAFARTVDRPRARLRSGARRRVVDNRNTLVDDHPFVEGVKTGHTAAAGYVLVGAAQGRGAEVVSVVLGAPSEPVRNQASLGLLRYGLDQFTRLRVARAGRAVVRRPVAGRGDASVGLEVPRGLTATVRRGRRPKLSVRAPEQIEGPLAPARRVGTLEVRDGARLLRSAPLVTASSVPAPAPLSQLRSPTGIGLLLTSLVLVAIVALAVTRSRRRRRTRAPAR